jgi:hypothetical protein
MSIRGETEIEGEAQSYVKSIRHELSRRLRKLVWIQERS